MFVKSHNSFTLYYIRLTPYLKFNLLILANAKNLIQSYQPQHRGWIFIISAKRRLCMYRKVNASSASFLSRNIANLKSSWLQSNEKAFRCSFEQKKGCQQDIVNDVIYLCYLMNNQMLCTIPLMTKTAISFVINQSRTNTLFLV